MSIAARKDLTLGDSEKAEGRTCPLAYHALTSKFSYKVLVSVLFMEVYSRRGMAYL
jgi:hypothetical protein